MSPDQSIMTPAERAELELTFLGWKPLEEQYENLHHQHECAALGMWVFLGTEVMFFGTLFVSLGTYQYLYPEACHKASEKLNWLIGGITTVVLLVSSLFMVLAVHYARLGKQRHLVICLCLTALLGVAFLCFKGLEYYIDYRENLIPVYKFDQQEWLNEGLRPDQVRHVQLFLGFYWIMTLLHGLHVIIGIAAVSLMAYLAWRGAFTPANYSAVDVTALYWHFVDTVWIFLLPMLYLLGTHHL
jgi:cytochrome c oxidase subunit III